MLDMTELTRQFNNGDTFKVTKKHATYVVNYTNCKVDDFLQHIIHCVSVKTIWINGSKFM